MIKIIVHNNYIYFGCGSICRRIYILGLKQILLACSIQTNHLLAVTDILFCNKGTIFEKVLK